MTNRAIVLLVGSLMAAALCALLLTAGVALIPEDKSFTWTPVLLMLVAAYAAAYALTGALLLRSELRNTARLRRMAEHPMVGVGGGMH